MTTIIEIPGCTRSFDLPAEASAVVEFAASADGGFFFVKNPMREFFAFASVVEPHRWLVETCAWPSEWEPDGAHGRLLRASTDQQQIRALQRQFDRAKRRHAAVLVSTQGVVELLERWWADPEVLAQTSRPEPDVVRQPGLPAELADAMLAEVEADVAGHADVTVHLERPIKLAKIDDLWLLYVMREGLGLSERRSTDREKIRGLMVEYWSERAAEV